MSEPQATYAAPPVDTAPLTAVDLQRIERRWGAIPDIRRLIESYRVLHYERLAEQAKDNGSD